MRVKSITDGGSTGTGTFLTNSCSIETYPLNEDVTIQVNCAAGYTGTVTLQHRANPSANWVSVGAAVTIPAGLNVVFTRKNGPEMRLSIAKTSAGKQTLNAWIGR